MFRFTKHLKLFNRNMSSIDYLNYNIHAKTAVASGSISVDNKTFNLIKNKQIGNNDILSIAKYNGMSTVNNSLLYQKNIINDFTCINIYLKEQNKEITATDIAEIEALNMVSTTCYTIYNICKIFANNIIIGNISIKYKSGGLNGLNNVMLL